MGEIVRRILSNAETSALLMENAAESNILPLNSTCNVWCKFCSHQQNPPEVEAYRIPAISMDLAEQALSLMDSDKPVVIGESVTRLMEGEPFIHPRIRDILLLMKEKMPGTPVRLTTNGNMLDESMVRFLASLGNVTIYLSLNSSDISVRKQLMNDAGAEVAVRSAVLLRKWSVPFHGSIVAMPHLTGWDDLSRTIRYFDNYGAITVRVFLPGHTALGPPDLVVPENMRAGLYFFIENIRKEINIPVTMEPPVISHLMAEVAGVIVRSPAWRIGVRPGDIIGKIDGETTKTRVDAFKRILAGPDPVIEVLRSGERHSFLITKEKGQTSGLVFDYDIDPGIVFEIERAARRRRAKRPVVLTSELGFQPIRLGLEKLSEKSPEIKPVAVKNRFFGGSIGCAGLLTVGDMMEVIEELSDEADLFIIPGVAFDKRGRDITGRSYLDLEVNGGSEIEVI